MGEDTAVILRNQFLIRQLGEENREANESFAKSAQASPLCRRYHQNGNDSDDPEPHNGEIDR